MAALVMMESSRLEVPPKLFTTRATSMPAVGKARRQRPNIDHGRSYILYIYIYLMEGHGIANTRAVSYTWLSFKVLVAWIIFDDVLQHQFHHLVSRL